MTLQIFLMIVGGITLLALAGLAVIAAIAGIKDLIDALKYRHYIKHRFDKPPTAKCYCVDCSYHDDETKRCYRFGEITKEYRCTADNWFCWEADPKRKEVDV
jgi:hypothetical protein